MSICGCKRKKNGDHRKHCEAGTGFIPRPTRRTTCTVCGGLSVPGLRKGAGKCHWHWCEANWGREWAIKNIGAEPRRLAPKTIDNPRTLGGHVWKKIIDEGGK